MDSGAYAPAYSAKKSEMRSQTEGERHPSAHRHPSSWKPHLPHPARTSRGPAPHNSLLNDDLSICRQEATVSFSMAAKARIVGGVHRIAAYNLSPALLDGISLPPYGDKKSNTCSNLFASPEL